MYKTTLFFTFFLSILSSCEGYDFKLKVKNSTPFDIYVIDYDTSSLKDYPNRFLNRKSDFIFKDSTIEIGRFGNWVDYVKNTRNNGLNIFVIQSDVAINYNRDSIINQKMYYKRLFYSLNDLEKLEWMIIIEDSVTFSKEQIENEYTN